MLFYGILHKCGTEQVDMAQVGEKNYSYLACGGFKDTSLMR